MLLTWDRRPVLSLKFSVTLNDGCIGGGSCSHLSCARTSASCGVGNGCYLVDPASSHMLVSKIKPCMCKYELIQTVKLRMAH